MKVIYNNIEIILNGEINIKENLDSIKSLIRGKYFDITGLILTDLEIESNIINFSSNNELDEIENTYIDKEKNQLNSVNIYGKMFNTNPKINSNISFGEDIFIWVNKISGEVFTCIDNTLNANVWSGSFGTKISITNETNTSNMIYIGMNEYSGAYLLDILGRRAASTKNISYSSGLMDRSVYLKSNSIVEILNSETLNFTGNWVISYLIKPRSLTYNQTHFEKSYNNEFGIYQDNSGRICVTFGNGSAYKHTLSQIPLRLNLWNHVKVSKNGLIITIEINGSVVGTVSTYTTTFLASEIVNSNEIIKIGYGSFGNLNAYIEEVILFQNEITQSDSINLTNKYLPYL